MQAAITFALQMRKITLLLCFFLLWTASAFAQIPCSAFCVDSLGLDTSGQNKIIISLRFEGSSSSFINYPYFHAIISEQGDTLAKGQLEYFGQFGNSTFLYSATTQLTELPENPQWNLLFRYDSLECLLPFPCAISASKNKLGNSAPRFYPNPFTDYLEFENFTEGKICSLFDHMGRMVWQGKAEKKSGQFRFNGLMPGFYIFKAEDSVPVQLLKE